jgi:hypothetical protein
VRGDRPAATVVPSQFAYPLERAALAIRMRSHCVTRTDEQAFHHMTAVEILINDRLHWNKSWSVSVPRIGF